MNKIIKIDRFFAWVLFGGMLAYFISGFGMSKGLINPGFATKIHMQVLTYIVLIAFVGHTSFAIHLAFKRWKMWNIPGIVVFVLFFLAFIFGFVCVDQFYKKPDISVSQTEAKENVLNDQKNSVLVPSSSTIKNNTASTNQKTFTLNELAKYNGQNGQPAYVAVDGDVYDLTKVFRSGKHFSHYAGTELTNAFYSYHAKRVLSKYSIVGKLTK